MRQNSDCAVELPGDSPTANGRADGADSGEAFAPLQDTRVQNYGQIIGLVVAESFEQARDAAFLVKTQYDLQEPIASWEEGLAKAFAPNGVGGEGAKVQILADGISSIAAVGGFSFTACS